MSAVKFMDTLARCLAPDLPMYLVKVQDDLAVYAGLWSTWLLNGDTARAAKVLLVTVLNTPGQRPPGGPLDLSELVPWVVLQCQYLTEESPAWEAVVGRALAPEMQRQGATPRPNPPQRGAALVQFTSTQDNHNSRAVAEPSPLVALRLTLWDGPAGSELPRPAPSLGRRSVEYRLSDVTPIRVFVAKAAPKSPLLRDMEADAGLARQGNVLGAINEWRTWFVADSLQ